MARRTWQLMVGSLLVCAVAAGCARTATTSDSMFESSGASAAVSGKGPGGVGGPDGQGGWTGGAGGTGGTGGFAAGGGHGVGNMPRVNPKEFVASAGLSDVHFDFDRYTIRSEDAPILDANAEWLKQNPGVMVLVEGHADERGTIEYNLALGDRRARAAVSYLVAQGVQARRIAMISYGENRPLCREASEDCWSRNRRAHFSVKQN